MAAVNAVAETDRLTLRRLSMDDLDAMIAVRCDPQVMAFSDGIMEPAGVKGWLKEILKHYDKHGYGHWAAVEKSTGAIIGHCGLFSDRDYWSDGESEIGYRLAKAYWGFGYATEASRAAITVGFQDFGLRRIVALVDPGNTASVRIVEKLGMTYERMIAFPGYDHPDHVYAIGRSP